VVKHLLSPHRIKRARLCSQKQVANSLKHCDFSHFFEKILKKMQKPKSTLCPQARLYMGKVRQREKSGKGESEKEDATI
jgi:hypothetical protein